MIHRIRKPKTKVNEQTKLTGNVRFDEGYFSIATSKKIKNIRGRGSKKKATVAVMAESVLLENHKTGEQYNWVGNFKMNVLESHEQNKIDDLLNDKISKNIILITDKCPS